MGQSTTIGAQHINKHLLKLLTCPKGDFPNNQLTSTSLSSYLENLLNLHTCPNEEKSYDVFNDLLDIKRQSYSFYGFLKKILHWSTRKKDLFTLKCEYSSIHHNKKLSETINKLFIFLSKVEMILKEGKSNGSSKLNTVIIGAGPIGLLNAFEVYSHTKSSIDIIEKRSFYSRHTWFDIYPQPYSFGYTFLKKLGFFDMNIQYEPQELYGKQVITIRCCILENFLMMMLKILSLHNSRIHIYRPYELISIEPSTITIQSKSKGLLSLKYNTLIGSDGYNSKVRSLLRFQYLPQSTFSLNSKFDITVNPLFQQVILASFRSIDGHCPTIRIDEHSNEKIDPFTTGILVDKVTNVFKRFYHGHCHLQILLENEIGSSIQESLWDVLFNVSKVILKDPPASLTTLKDWIIEDELSILNISIHESFPLGKQFTNGSCIFIHGDAALNAHFRLGVGVNNGFIAMEQKELSGYINGYYNFDKKINIQRKRLDALLNYQLSTMFFESYCHFQVFSKGHLYSQSLHEYVNNVFVPIGDDIDTIYSKCPYFIEREKLNKYDL